MKSRLCIKCKIGWDHYKLGRPCPKCQDDGLFTIPVNDVRIENVMSEIEMTHADFAEYKQAEFNHRYEG